MKVFIIVKLLTFLTALIAISVKADCPDFCDSGLCCSEVCQEYGYDFPYCESSDDCYVSGGFIYCQCTNTCNSLEYDIIKKHLPKKKKVSKLLKQETLSVVQKLNITSDDQNIKKDANSCPDFCASGVCCSDLCQANGFPYPYCPSSNECYVSGGFIFCECTTAC